MERSEYAEAAALLAKWEAEAARRVPAWEHVLEQQNLDPKQLLTRAAGAFAGRDVMTEQYRLVVNDYALPVAFIHYLKVRGDITEADFELYVKVVGRQITIIQAQQRSAKARATDRQRKNEVFAFLAARPPGSASCTDELVKKFKVGKQCAQRWQREFRASSDYGKMSREEQTKHIFDLSMRGALNMFRERDKREAEAAMIRKSREVQKTDSLLQAAKASLIMFQGNMK
jgi:hypothetical protein